MSRKQCHHQNKLPFVVFDSETGKNNFWQVRPTGDHLADEALGELFAKVLLDDLKKMTFMLGWIAKAQALHGNESDEVVRVAFWHVIAMSRVI